MGLKEERIKNKMTQQELAFKIGISVGNIYKIEKNNSCNLETAYKIAKVLNTTIEKIFFEIEKE